MEDNSLLKQTLDELKNLREAAKKLAAQDPDVVEGRLSLEDQLKEPQYLLYDNITKSVSSILSEPTVVAIFNQLSGELGEKVTSSIVTLMAVTMVESANQAVLFYDDLLHKSISKHFEAFSQAINSNTSDLVAYKQALDIFRSRLDKISTKMEAEDIAKSVGMTAKSVK